MLIFQQTLNLNLTCIIISSLCGIHFPWNVLFFSSSLSPLPVQLNKKALLAIRQIAVPWIQNEEIRWTTPWAFSKFTQFWVLFRGKNNDLEGIGLEKGKYFLPALNYLCREHTNISWNNLFSFLFPFLDLTVEVLVTPSTESKIGKVLLPMASQGDRCLWLGYTNGFWKHYSSRMLQH